MNREMAWRAIHVLSSNVLGCYAVRTKDTKGDYKSSSSQANDLQRLAAGLGSPLGKLSELWRDANIGWALVKTKEIHNLLSRV